MSSPESQPAVNPVAPVVVALFLLIIGVEAIFWLGANGVIGGPDAIGWRSLAIQDYAFSDRVFDWMAENGRWLPEHLMRFVTYPFVAPSFTHAIIGAVMLIALGKMVGDNYAGWATLALYIVPCIGGALAYGVLLDTPLFLAGPFVGVYGLIGGYTYIMWVHLGALGQQQIQAFMLIAFLMGAQLLFGLLFGGGPDWLADLAAFVTGLVLAVAVAPGSFGRFLARIRRD